MSRRATWMVGLGLCAMAGGCHETADVGNYPPDARRPDGSSADAAGPAALTWTTESLGANGMGIWGTDDFDIYVVAQTIGASGAFIAHSTGGGAWAVQPSGSTVGLFDVAGNGAHDVYAVGLNGTILHSLGDGTWTPQSSGTTAALYGVWEAASGDVYAVGDMGTILHSTGDGVWTSEPGLTSDAGTNQLWDVWGSGPTDVYLAGDHGIAHSTGDGTWTVEATTPAPMLGVAGSASTDVWAVGQGPGSGAVLHSNGDGTWDPVDIGLGSSHVQLNGVWVSPTGDVFITANGAVYRWAGGTLAATAPGSWGTLQHAWGTSSDDVFVVGQTGDSLLHLP